MFSTFSASLVCLFAVSAGAFGQTGLNGLPEVTFANLSDKNISALGKAALAIRAAEWKHAETANFVYHFFQSFVVTPVSVEAEAYYRYIANDLDRDTAQWERKCHVYVFERPADWRTFQASARLDPWTGGIHSRGELFIVRDPAFKWKGHTLAHEVAHLVVDRFFGSGVPLWLNEGYAEYAGQRAYASYHRARGFNARPASHPIAPTEFMPLSQLIGFIEYPSDARQVATFYNESEKLVRFLSVPGRSQFVNFLDSLAKGARIETALAKGFGSRFQGLEALEREFKTYASKDYGFALQRPGSRSLSD